MTRSGRKVYLTIAALALAGALAPAAPDPAAANRALAREQLQVVEQAEADLNQLVKGGKVTRDDRDFILWARRKVDALRASGAAKNQVVAALEHYVDTLKHNEAFLDRAYQKGLATRDDLHDIHYRRLEAEMWLNREKAE